jgi:hypothetical protein
VRVEGLLEVAEVLVEDAEGDDQEEGEKEGSGGGDVPLAEDDAGVDDLGVPWCVCGRVGECSGMILGLGTYQSMFIVHLGPIGILSWSPWSMVKAIGSSNKAKQPSPSSWQAFLCLPP